MPGIIALENIKVASLRMLQEATSYAFIQLRPEDLSIESDQMKKMEQESEGEEFQEAREELNKWLNEFAKLSNNKEIDIIIDNIRKIEKKLYKEELNLMNLKYADNTSEKLLSIKQILEEIEEEFLGLIDLAIMAKVKEFEFSRDKAEQTAQQAKQINIILFLVALGSALLLGNLVSKAVMRQLTTLTQATKAIGAGELDTRVQVQSRDEIGELANAFNDMAVDLSSSRAALSEAHDALEHRVEERTTELQRAHQELEMRVAERTSELLQTNNQLTVEIAERARAEADLQRFADDLKRNNRELQDFAYVASHDLQEPLRKIQAFGDRLKDKCGEALSEQGQDYLARMQNAAIRMQTFITDLLTFSRVTTQAKPFVPVDLGQVVQEVLSDLEVRIEEVRAQMEVGQLPTLDADPVQMRQLLQNLIGNALKFHHPEAPPVIAIEAHAWTPKPHSLNATPDVPPLCQLTVADNGIGFDEKYLDRIFTVFQRLNGRSTYEGTGIGLVQPGGNNIPIRGPFSASHEIRAPLSNW